MIPDELTAATNRVREFRQLLTTGLRIPEVYELVYGVGPQQVHKYLLDEQAIVDAYLVEHPADDPELLTADWLRSVGFTDDPTDAVFLRTPLPGSLYPAYLCVCSDPDSKIDGGNAVFTSYDRRKDGSDDLDTEDMVVTGKDVIRTRGDVRRLLRALSITTGDLP